MVIDIIRMNLEKSFQFWIKTIEIVNNKVLWRCVVNGRCPISSYDFYHDLVKEEVWETACSYCCCFFYHWEWSYKEGVRWKVLIKEVAFQKSDDKREFYEKHEIVRWILLKLFVLALKFILVFFLLFIFFKFIFPSWCPTWEWFLLLFISFIILFIFFIVNFFIAFVSTCSVIHSSIDSIRSGLLSNLFIRNQIDMSKELSTTLKLFFYIVRINQQKQGQKFVFISVDLRYHRHYNASWNKKASTGYQKQNHQNMFVARWEALSIGKEPIRRRRDTG